MKQFDIIVTNEYKGLRIDRFLCEKIDDISRSYIQKLLDEALITVDNKNVSKNHKLSPGEHVHLEIPEAKPLEVKAENIPLNIMYEDSDLIIVNKPQDMVVHPAPGHLNNTLVNALLNHCKDSLSGINGVLRPGIVHRIDKDTSGLLIVAKNDTSHQILCEQIKSHSFKREYEAIVCGNITENSGRIKNFIGRHKINRKKMSVVTIGGKLAITHFEVIKNYNGYSHVRLKLETGRTHQIRIHMNYIGHSVLADPIYGKNQKNNFPFLIGQCLHARTLGFNHPTTNQYMEFTSDLPPYFKRVLDILEHK